MYMWCYRRFGSYCVWLFFQGCGTRIQTAARVVAVKKCSARYVAHSRKKVILCCYDVCVFAGLCHQDAVHITAILGESVVFNCHVEFPGDHPVPYVLQWEKKVGETVRHKTLFYSSFVREWFGYQITAKFWRLAAIALQPSSHKMSPVRRTARLECLFNDCVLTKNIDFNVRRG